MMLSFSAEIKMRSGKMGEMRGCCFLCDEERGDEDRLTQAKNEISQRSRQVVCQWPLSRCSSAVRVPSTCVARKEVLLYLPEVAGSP